MLFLLQEWHPWRRRYHLFLGHTAEEFRQFAQIDSGLLAWNFFVSSVLLHSKLFPANNDCLFPHSCKTKETRMLAAFGKDGLAWDANSSQIRVRLGPVRFGQYLPVSTDGNPFQVNTPFDSPRTRKLPAPTSQRAERFSPPPFTLLFR